MSKPRTKKSYLEDRTQLWVHVMGSHPIGRATVITSSWREGQVIPTHQKDLLNVYLCTILEGEPFWAMGQGAMTSWRGKDEDTFLRDWRPITRERFSQLQKDMRDLDYQNLFKGMAWREAYDAKLQLRRELAAELLADDSLTD